jgi:hypothetical protein
MPKGRLSSNKSTSVDYTLVIEFFNKNENVIFSVFYFFVLVFKD